ncbi:MAG: M23 family metallopeptidase [Bdellovibrionota bacterium]
MELYLNLLIFKKESGRIPLKLILLIIFLAAAIPALLFGWKELYAKFLERSHPVVEILEFPRGIGAAPVLAHLRISDTGAGLDEIVVRTKQKRKSKELLRKSFNGAQTGELVVEFPGRESGLEEGTATLEIRVFDKSFWSNRTEKNLPLLVDYEKPSVEVLSVQHNAHLGGAQFVFYKAYDNTLAISGVRIGENRYLGYPAQGLDEDLLEPNLFVAIYAIDVEKPPLPSEIRVFAEDQAGNSNSTGFYNKILGRRSAVRSEHLTPDFLRNKVSNLLLNFATEELSSVSKFLLANKKLRSVNERQLKSYIKGPRFEALWEEAFEPFPATPAAIFGDKINYYLDNQQIDSSVLHNMVYLFPYSRLEVPAAAPGVVLFTGSLGVYGDVVLVDHGLGLVALYGQLETISVHKADQIETGTLIGTVGSTGLTQRKALLYGMFVHGTPVNPMEWFDKSWYNSHVTLKIEELKKDLGIPVYRPLN